MMCKVIIVKWLMKKLPGSHCVCFTSLHRLLITYLIYNYLSLFTVNIENAPIAHMCYIEILWQISQ